MVVGDKVGGWWRPEQGWPWEVIEGVAETTELRVSRSWRPEGPDQGVSWLGSCYGSPCLSHSGNGWPGVPGWPHVLNV